MPQVYRVARQRPRPYHPPSMQPITLRTSNERIIRAVIAFLLLTGFAAAFLWDGYVGYPKKNRDEFVKLIGWTGTEPRIIENLDDGPALADAIEREKWTLDRVTQKLGPPSVTLKDEVYFLGKAGWLKLQMLPGGQSTEKVSQSVNKVSWHNAPTSATDQKFQRWIGWALAPLSLIFLVQLVRVLRTRASLTAQGVTITGHGHIPMEAITGIRPDPSGKPGLYVLEYTHEGHIHRVRMDSYLYHELPKLIEAVSPAKS